MRTVKQVSELTGISVRTLRYYDEIGLLNPTMLSEAGYRLYDDKALEVLQQILFFKEFDVPLKKILAIMTNPDFDKMKILSDQKRILLMERKRLDGMINLIDDLLKGDNAGMDFEVFNRKEIEDMYEIMLGNMTDERKKIIEEQYGDLNQYRTHFIEKASDKKAQANYQKMVEWYGSKDKVIESMKNIQLEEVIKSYQKRSQVIYDRIAAAKGKDVNTFEVKQIIGELDFVSKQIYNMEDVSRLMVELADAYQINKELGKYYDEKFGDGAAFFIGKAIKAFYK